VTGDAHCECGVRCECGRRDDPVPELGWPLRAGVRDRGWDDAEGGRGRLQRLAGDGAPLVAPEAGGGRGSADNAVLSVDRSSCPRRSPRQLGPELAETICECRRKTGWGPRLVAGATGFAHSTVWKVLRRAGISRPPRP
jgi:hypothetical protein